MEFLEPLTVELDFVKDGELVFSATSWAGYVGVLTGMRPNGYSVSVNFRLTEGSFFSFVILDGALWTNIKNAMSGCWPVGFLLRDVFEETRSYRKAVQYLSNSYLISPCYYTCCGTKPGQGCIITRDVKSECQRYTLEDGDVIQPNMDHFSNDPDMDIMDSMERRDLARVLLLDLDEVNKNTLWGVMSVDPIFNEITIYGTYMSPSQGILETRIPNDSSGFNPTVITPRLRKESVIYLTEEQLVDPEYRRRQHYGDVDTWHLEETSTISEFVQ